MASLEARFTTACIRHLTCVNPDTLNKFKRQIPYTKIHLPLIDLFIEWENTYFSNLRNSSMDLKEKNIFRNNAEALKIPILKYLNCSRESKPYEAWGALYTSKEVNLKEILISIEELNKTPVAAFNKKEKLLEWVNLAEQAHISQKIQDALRELKESIEKEDPTAFQLSINRAKQDF